MVDEYLRRYANQIAEANSQGNFNTPEIIANSLRLSRVATPKDFADFKEAFKDYDHGLGSWKKWGGGNKMGSAGAAVNAARRARAEARRSAPDANVNNYTNKNLADRLGLTALSNFVDSRVNDTQGKNMPSNPSFVGVGANPSFQSIGTQFGNMIGATPSIGSYGDVSSFSNFTGGLPSLSNLSSFASPSSFLSDMAMGSLIAGGIPYGTPGADDPFADHDDTPIDLNDDSDFPDDLFGIGDIRASIPRFAGIFAV